MGSSRSPELLVPTSRRTGNVRAGSIPPSAVYRDSFPIGIPMPPMPWSPRPRTRCPSVTTITSTSRRGRLRRISPIRSRSGGDEQPAWPPVDLAEPLAGHPDSGGVEDRQHFLDVVGYQPVEQHFVGVLQRAQ